MQLEISQLFDVRFHGRAGQGVVTVSRLLGEAALLEGKFIHAFPNFGPERMGAPVSAFTRIDENKFTVKSEVYNPDLIVIIDPTLVSDLKYYQGLKENGIVILNTKIVPNKVKEHLTNKEIWYIDGDNISRKHLGRTIANTVMLGAVVKVTALVKLDTIYHVLSKKFSQEITEKNMKAIKEAFEEVRKIE
jgi:2-oxoisovalerate/pyruvate ferredoxin oxidoreductase gamma subunit